VKTDWLGLHGKVCVVTGAGGGIGREAVLEFARSGAIVVALDLHEQGCAETASMAVAAGATGALALQCDISDPDGVAAAADETTGRFGRCDVLVNNAGILRAGKLEDVPISDWDLMLRVNLTGILLCSRAFGRNMLERGAGALVHTASIAAGQPQAFSGAYSVSKSAVVMLSRQLAFEWGPRGVRSNVVSPGLVRTPMSSGFYETVGVTEAREAVVPLRRIGDPGDMASTIAFLAGSRAGYITGQDIVVDGGFSQTLMSHVPRPGHSTDPGVALRKSASTV
jgi:NAD(P)-dependent dehydrogenase (short-subunit alcohol dehydrogenase family)